MKTHTFCLFIVSLISNFAMAQSNQSPQANQVCFNNIDTTNFSFVSTNFYITKGENSTLRNGLPVVDVVNNCFTIYSDLKPSNYVFDNLVDMMGWLSHIQGPSPMPNKINNPNLMPVQTNMTFAKNIYPYCSDISTDNKNITCNTLDFAVGGVMSFGYQGVYYTCSNVIFAEGSYYNNNDNFAKAINIWSGYGNAETPDNAPVGSYTIKCNDTNNNEKDFYITNSPNIYNRFVITD